MSKRADSRRVLGTRWPQRETNGTRPPAIKQTSNQNSLAVACPICQENMESLGQLNRHLDDEHVEVTDAVSEIGVRSWFQKQLNKSAKMAPVAAVSKTLRITEDFERNDDADLNSIDATKSTDALVTTSHWEHSSAQKKCHEQGCSRGVQSSRSINCRHCGKLFCSQHTLYQMRLSRSAIYEPHRGIWCRVCRGCYESRAWYKDSQGAFNDLTEAFNVIRQRQVDVVHLKAQMLERRMTKLLQGLSNLEQPNVSFFGLSTPIPSSAATAKRREFEETIVPWDDAKLVLACPLCTASFTLDRRKHHCRMCGRCICGDSKTMCSMLVDFNVDAQSSVGQGKPRKEQVRLCKDCNELLFQFHDDKRHAKRSDMLQDKYSRMRQYREGVDTLMPRFQTLVAALSQKSGHDKSAFDEVNRVKKVILDSLAQIETLATSIGQNAATSRAQQQVQNAILAETKTFLQARVLTLQTIANVSKKPVKVEEASEPEAQNLAEQQQLRDEIAMFTEQRYLLSQQAEEARRRRKFEDHSSIQASIDEIDKELTERQKQLILWTSEA